MLKLNTIHNYNFTTNKLSLELDKPLIVRDALINNL